MHELLGKIIVWVSSESYVVIAWDGKLSFTGYVFRNNKLNKVSVYLVSETLELDEALAIAPGIGANIYMDLENYEDLHG